MADGQLGNSQSPTLRELIPDDDLLRALSKKAWLEDLHEAFFLRSSDEGLSVCYDCNAEQCLDVLPWPGLTAIFGVAVLKVERVINLGLMVIPDSQNHAVIQGIPHKEVDPVGAEHLASRLAEAATIVDRTRRTRC